MLLLIITTHSSLILHTTAIRVKASFNRLEIILSKKILMVYIIHPKLFPLKYKKNLLDRVGKVLEEGLGVIMVDSELR